VFQGIFLNDLFKKEIIFGENTSEDLWVTLDNVNELLIANKMFDQRMKRKIPTSSPIQLCL